MSAHSPLAASLTHDQTPPPVAERLLLRFLVQRGVIHRSLLNLIEIEHSGSGSTLSLVDWLVQRGHVSEEALTSVLSACLNLQPRDLARFALAPEPSRTRTPRHLKLVSSRPGPSDTPTTDTSSFPDRRRRLQLPRKLRRLA